MKTIKQIAVIAGVLFASATTGAFADDKWIGDTGSNWQDHIQSTKSRAEVIAELNEARATGLLSVGEDPFYPRTQAIESTKSRAEVIAELNEARAAGLLIVGEDPSYPRDQTIVTNRVRHDVRTGIAAKPRQGYRQN